MGVWGDVIDLEPIFEDVPADGALTILEDVKQHSLALVGEAGHAYPACRIIHRTPRSTLGRRRQPSLGPGDGTLNWRDAGSPTWTASPGRRQDCVSGEGAGRCADMVALSMRRVSC